MSEPTTQAGKALHTEAWEWSSDYTVDGHSNDPANCPACDIIERIEREAAAVERERLREAHVPTHPDIPIGVTWMCSTCILLAEPVAAASPEDER